MIYFFNLSSDFGPISIVWKKVHTRAEIAILRIFLSDSEMDANQKRHKEYPGTMKNAHLKITNLIKTFQTVLKGIRGEFPLDLLDFSQCSPFQEEVLRLEATIPLGYVSTYKIIAEKLGKPNHFRQVAKAFSQNPFPIWIPCHRVIRTNYSLTGYQGGPAMKEELLRLEGVPFDEKKKLDDLDCLYTF